MMLNAGQRRLRKELRKPRAGRRRLRRELRKLNAGRRRRLSAVCHHHPNRARQIRAGVQIVLATELRHRCGSHG